MPNTFVSSNPFYVVNNVKQIKPFLLLVQGTGDPIEHTMTDKELFRHDPQLRQQPAFYGSPLQVVSGVLHSSLNVPFRPKNPPLP